jgi:hypothetical protein
MSRIGLLIGVLTLVAAPLDVALAQIAKREPPLGALKPGQRLLVDDGTCGPGQIKEVIGGDHVAVGGRAHVVRERRCIPR